MKGAECEVWMGELRSRFPLQAALRRNLLGRIGQRVEKFVNDQRSFWLYDLLLSRTEIPRLHKVLSVSSHHVPEVLCSDWEVVDLKLMTGRYNSGALRGSFSITTPPF